MDNMKRLSFAWLYSFGVILLTTFLLRLFFLPFYQQDLDFYASFHALWWGVRFDLATAGLVSLILLCVFLIAYPLRRYHLKTTLAAFYLSLAAVFISHIGDFLYFLQAGRHVGYEVNTMFADAEGLVFQAWHLYSVWIISGLLASIIWIYGVRQLTRFYFLPKIQHYPRTGHVSMVAISIAIMLLNVIIVRGGVTGVAQSPLHVYAIGNADKALMASNSAYTIFYSLLASKSNVERINIPAPDGSAEDHFVSLFNQQDPIDSGQQLYQNIVIVFLESWAAAYMDDDTTPEVTPVFNHLASNGLSTKQMVAGGRRTTEGLFSSLCSWQNPLGGSIAHSVLQNNTFTCLPQVLTEHGYNSLFIQGSNKNTSGTGVFAQRLGFQQSFGKSDMPDGRYAHNAWGAHDPDIYQFALDKIAHTQQPFIAGINTNSTHDIALPDGIQPLVAGVDDKSVALSVLHFSDEALGQFIEKFQRQLPAIYEQTLFVLVSDHTSNIDAGHVNRFRIPFAMWGQGVPIKQISRPAHQRDILPTVLDVVGISVDTFLAGKSMVRDNEAPYFSDYYINGVLGWIENNELIHIDLYENQLDCFKLDQLYHAQGVICDKQHFEMRNNALAFSAVSQDLLFNNDIQNAGILFESKTKMAISSSNQKKLN